MNEVSKPITTLPPSGDAFRLHNLTVAVSDRREELALAKLAAARADSRGSQRRARRAVRTAGAALSAAQAALEAEQRGEAAAPAVQRQEIVSEAGVVIREPRVEMRGRRAELTPALERLYHRSTITRPEYQAGRRYREAWEAAGLDLYPIGPGDGGGRSAPSSGNRRIEEAVSSSAELTSARSCLGRFGTAMLDHIVVDGLTIASWAEAKGESEHVAKGVLKMALTRLAEFWQAFDANP